MPPAARRSLSPQKARGAYYTPAPLIELLFHRLGDTPKLTGGAMKILDPACGQGDFLVEAKRHYPSASLWGVDINPDAAQQASAALGDDAHIAAADALLAPPAFLKPRGFDLIVGNPPFVNPIEGYLSPATKQALKQRFPMVRGAADLACYFLQQAVELVRPGGRIALVLPRAMLNSPAAATIRAGLPPWLKPNLIYAPERHDFFPQAIVFVCAVILGPDSFCRFSTDPDPASASFTAGCITTDNWWLALKKGTGTFLPVPEMWPAGREDAAGPKKVPVPFLSAVFEIQASMTAGDAYDLVPHLVDSPAGEGLKFVTTGLIEPGKCDWGRRRCRYLRRDYQHPRLNCSEETLSSSFKKRLNNARRPKLLVAGLARRIEAFLDENGECIGAVSTYSIYHPADDLDALRKLLAYLHSPPVTQWLVEHEGGNGLRGRHITIKKRFLQSLPMPGQSLTT